jgi:hypothetical protein
VNSDKAAKLGACQQFAANSNTDFNSDFKCLSQTFNSVLSESVTSHFDVGCAVSEPGLGPSTSIKILRLCNLFIYLLS